MSKQEIEQRIAKLLEQAEPDFGIGPSDPDRLEQMKTALTHTRKAYEFMDSLWNHLENSGVESGPLLDYVSEVADTLRVSVARLELMESHWDEWMRELEEE